jgi:hypothetical protein
MNQFTIAGEWNENSQEYAFAGHGNVNAFQ